MLARIVRAPLHPERRDEAISLYQTLLPRLRAQPGFTGALLLTDRTTGHALSLTLWNETTMEVDPALFRHQLATFDTLIAGTTAVELYEVSVDALLPTMPCPDETDWTGTPLDTAVDPRVVPGDEGSR